MLSICQDMLNLTCRGTENMIHYFYAAEGYKDNKAKLISGIYDSSEEDALLVWKTIKAWLIKDKEFDGDFTIIGFNKV